MKTKSARFALFALAWPLLGCGDFERAILQWTTGAVAASALVVGAFAGVQIGRRKFGPIQFGVCLAMTLVALGAGAVEVGGALRVGVPIATSYHVALNLSTLLWAAVLALVASDTKRWELKLPAFVIAALYGSLVLVTTVWLWPGPRLPEGAVVETSMSDKQVCLRFEGGEVVCYGALNGTEGRWPTPLDAPPAVALHGGDGQKSCLSTAEGELWCFGPTLPTAVELPFEVEGGLDEVQVLGGGILIREGSRWHYLEEEERVGPFRGGLGDELEEVLDGSLGVAASDARVCVLQDMQVRCSGSGADFRLLEDLSPADRVSTNGRIACSSHGAEVRCEGESPLGGIHSLPTAVQQLELGRHHVCARTDTELFCWGHGRAGRLGMGSESRSEPTALPLENVTQLSLHEEFSCAISSGEVLCWGVARQGVLLEGESEFDSVGPLRDLLSPRHYWDQPSRLVR